MAEPGFAQALSEAAERVEAALDALLPRTEEGRVAEAMRYAALSGGKRLRAFLVMEGAGMFNVADHQADRAAAAIECIHAYSLIHDDLPAMDDDDLRRGLPTVHRKWDEATAVLAGDGLQAEAFAILAHPRTAQDATIRARLVQRLAEAAGARGMVGGQDLDLLAEQTRSQPDVEAITDLQRKKTGALITWSAEAGAIMGKSDPDPMIAYSDNIGLAFQIRDDILDVTGNAEETGKAVGKDAAAGKATFVSLLGLEQATALCAGLADAACDALAPYGANANRLKALAQFVVERSS